MKICGIICEFNPLHYGHLHLIEQIKQEYDAVVCVMSGNFVQRGEPAILSKFSRARAAVESGCDLVVELPVPYSLSTAMYFARGGVDLLNSLGGVEALCFGSECGDIEQIKAIAAVLESDSYREVLKKELKKGLPFAAARQNTVAFLNPELNASILQNPNDILAVEYCAAIQAQNSKVQPFCIRRIGPGHDSQTANGRVASASKIRELIQSGKDCSAFLPPASYKAVQQAETTGQIANISYLERAIVAYLRTVPAENLQQVPDVSEGLHNKISIAANSYATLEEIYMAVKSKRYSLARIRRIGLCAYLGITYGMQKRSVPYCRVLGMNETGAAVLSYVHKKTAIPLVASLKEAERCGDYSALLAKLENRCGDIYSLLLQNPTGGKREYTAKLFKTF